MFHKSPCLDSHHRSHQTNAPLAPKHVARVVQLRKFWGSRQFSGVHIYICYIDIIYKNYTCIYIYFNNHFTNDQIVLGHSLNPLDPWDCYNIYLLIYYEIPPCMNSWVSKCTIHRPMDPSFSFTKSDLASFWADFPWSNRPQIPLLMSRSISCIYSQLYL